MHFLRITRGELKNECNDGRKIFEKCLKVWSDECVSWGVKIFILEVREDKFNKKKQIK